MLHHTKCLSLFLLPTLIACTARNTDSLDLVSVGEEIKVVTPGEHHTFNISVDIAAPRRELRVEVRAQFAQGSDGFGRMTGLMVERSDDGPQTIAVPIYISPTLNHQAATAQRVFVTAELFEADGGGVLPVARSTRTLAVKNISDDLEFRFVDDVPNIVPGRFVTVPVRTTIDDSVTRRELYVSVGTSLADTSNYANYGSSGKVEVGRDGPGEAQVYIEPEMWQAMASADIALLTATLFPFEDTPRTDSGDINFDEPLSIVTLDVTEQVVRPADQTTIVEAPMQVALREGTKLGIRLSVALDDDAGPRDLHVNLGAVPKPNACGGAGFVMLVQAALGVVENVTPGEAIDVELPIQRETFDTHCESLSELGDVFYTALLVPRGSEDTERPLARTRLLGITLTE